MKKFFAIFAAAAAILILVSCGHPTPLLKVILKPENTDTADHDYLVLYNNGKTGETDAFTPDNASFYTAGVNTFKTTIENNKVCNSIDSVVLFDANGLKAEADETMTSLLQAAAESIEHSILQFTIITDDSRYFAFVKLNVNWQSPCILYEYDATSRTLTELCRWDGVDLVGIAVS